MAATEIPAPLPDDDEDVSWALSTAAALWGRGEREEALKWLRRAAEQASDADRDDRSLELVRAAADLSHAIGPARSTPPPKSIAPAAPPSSVASRPPPPPVPSRPPPVPSRPPPAPSRPPPAPPPVPAPSVRPPERAAPPSVARPPISQASGPASLPTPTPTTLPSRAAPPVSAGRPATTARAPAPPSSPRDDDALASTQRQDEPTQPGAPKKRLGTLLGNAPPPDAKAASTPRREVTLPGPLEDGRHKAKRRTASRPGREPKTTELPAVPEARPAEPSTPPWDDLEEDGVTLMRTVDRRLFEPAAKAPAKAAPPAAAPPSAPPTSAAPVAPRAARAVELPRMTDDLEEETNVLSGAHDDGLDDLTTVARRGAPVPAKPEKRAPVAAKAAPAPAPAPAAAPVAPAAPPAPPSSAPGAPQAAPVERAPSLPAVRVAVLPGAAQGELRVVALGADLSPPPGAMLAVLVPMSEADGELVTRGLFGG